MALNKGGEDMDVIVVKAEERIFNSVF